MVGTDGVMNVLLIGAATVTMWVEGGSRRAAMAEEVGRGEVAEPCTRWRRRGDNGEGKEAEEAKGSLGGLAGAWGAKRWP